MLPFFGSSGGAGVLLEVQLVLGRLMPQHVFF
jgi:hypothetical protein